MGRYSDELLATSENAETAPSRKYSAQLLDGEDEQPNQPMTTPPPTQTVFQQFKGQLQSPTMNAALGGAGDAAMGDIIEKNLGDRFIRRERGNSVSPTTPINRGGQGQPLGSDYEVFVTRGEDGQEQRGYLNAPGFDDEDFTRAVYGAVPYALTGGLAGIAAKGAGMGVNALAQGAAAAATSVAGDAANVEQGSKQGLDPFKAATVAAFGAAGPPVSAAAGALYRRFVTIPGLIDEATGQLTARGLEAAQRAGINPQELTPDFAKSFANTFAKTGDETLAATQAGTESFGIPSSRGQLTKDPYLLTQEEGARRRLYGESAQDTMRGFDERQAEAIRFAALGEDNALQQPARGAFAPRKGIGETINPARQPGAIQADRSPAVLGESVQTGVQSAREGARKAEADMWDDGVKNLSATPQALATLRGRISTALSDETDFTQTGEKMAKTIGQFADSDLPVSAVGGVTLKPVQSVDQMRRRLGSMVGEAQPGSDKRQAGMIYDAFNDWIGESAAAKLLAGDPAAAMQLVKARAFTKEVRDLFEPKAAGGRTSPAAQRIGKILDDAKADSGEGVIQALFGSQGSRSANDGGVLALTNIKRALDAYAPKDQAAQAWNDIRLAYWTRLVSGKNGELVGPTAMMNNIKSAFQGQSTVVRILYSPTELSQMRQFMRALQTVSYKPPNASGSGYTAASFIKDGLMKIVDAFGIGTPARAALSMSGLENALGAANAKRAVSQAVPVRRPNLTPALTSGGQAYYQSQDQSGGGR